MASQLKTPQPKQMSALAQAFDNFAKALAPRESLKEIRAACEESHRRSVRRRTEPTPGAVIEDAIVAIVLILCAAVTVMLIVSQLT